MIRKEIEIFYPISRQHWREWLQAHHDTQTSVCLLYFKKKCNKPTITWSDAVEEALCFGWIDSKKTTVDEESFMQIFSKRKAQSTWSKINKEKVQLLIVQGLMTKAGLESIETAKQNGSWIILDEVEALRIPADLEKEFQKRPNAESYFLSLSKTDKKTILQWITLAKRTETRQNRINEIVELADQNLKPKLIR